MMLTNNIGGQLDMDSRYYIRGGKIYTRYNRRFSSREPIRALRQEEVKIALIKSKLLSICITAVIICILLEGGFLIKSLGQYHNDIVDNEDVVSTNVKASVDTMNNMVDTVSIDVTVTQTRSKGKTNTSVEDNDNRPELVNQYQAEDLVFRKSSGDIVNIGDHEFMEMDLPNVYYPNIDCSSFQPIEPVQKITDKNSPAYAVSYSDNAYTDKNGLRRYNVSNDEFSLDGQDDYVVAMGNFYKEKGSAGDRFLVQTSNGAFTIIVGDEKNNDHTDKMNMFTTHNGKAGFIEFIYDENSISSEILQNGTPMNGPDPVLSGEIINIYKIL